MATNSAAVVAFGSSCRPDENFLFSLEQSLYVFYFCFSTTILVAYTHSVYDYFYAAAQSYFCILRFISASVGPCLLYIMCFTFALIEMYILLCVLYFCLNRTMIVPYTVFQFCLNS